MRDTIAPGSTCTIDKNGFYYAGIGLGIFVITYLPSGIADVGLGGNRLSQDAQGAEAEAAAAANKPWRLGDNIYAPTAAGNAPNWSTVRARFWKNESEVQVVDNWSAENLQRMRNGLAPQRYNPDKGGIESMELSHEPIPFRDGGVAIVPRWPQDHAAVDPYRKPGY